MAHQKYADMLAAGAEDLAVSHAMRDDGFSPKERGDIWAIIKPRKPYQQPEAPAPRPVGPCKFQAAANLLLDGGVTDVKTQHFVSDVAGGLPKLSVKQKKWIKALCDTRGIPLKYAPRASATKDIEWRRTKFTDKRFVPYGQLDIPVWSDELGCWVDAEY